MLRRIFNTFGVVFLAGLAIGAWIGLHAEASSADQAATCVPGQHSDIGY